jgi:hypothetical protein
VETTYLFVELSRRVLALSEGPLGEMTYYLAFHRMMAAGRRALLAPHGIRTSAHRFGMELREAPETQAKFRVAFTRPAETGVVAYRLLAQVYAWFDHTAGTVPYVSKRDEQPVIDAEKIIADGQP